MKRLIAIAAMALVPALATATDSGTANIGYVKRMTEQAITNAVLAAKGYTEGAKAQVQSEFAAADTTAKAEAIEAAASDATTKANAATAAAKDYSKSHVAETVATDQSTLVTGSWSVSSDQYFNEVNTLRIQKRSAGSGIELLFGANVNLIGLQTLETFRQAVLSVETKPNYSNTNSALVATISGLLPPAADYSVSNTELVATVVASAPRADFSPSNDVLVATVQSMLPDLEGYATQDFVAGAVSAKQDKLTAGPGIVISGTTISTQAAAPDFSPSNSTLVATIQSTSPTPDFSPSNSTLVATIQSTSPTPDYSSDNDALMTTIRGVVPEKATGLSLHDSVRNCDWYLEASDGSFIWYVED